MAQTKSVLGKELSLHPYASAKCMNAAVTAALAARAAAAVSAAAEDEQEYDDDPEAASVSISAEHLIDLSPRYVIYPGPAPRGGRARRAVFLFGAVPAPVRTV